MMKTMTKTMRARVEARGRMSREREMGMEKSGASSMEMLTAPHFARGMA